MKKLILLINFQNVSQTWSLNYKISLNSPAIHSVVKISTEKAREDHV